MTDETRSGSTGAATGANASSVGRGSASVQIRRTARLCEVLASIHLLPQRTGLERVFADEELAEVMDGGRHGHLAAGEARLAPADNAFVRLDLDDELLAPPHV